MNIQQVRVETTNNGSIVCTLYLMKYTTLENSYTIYERNICLFPTYNEIIT